MQIRPHIDSYSVSTNDIYVICSDGLSDKIGQDRIAQVLSGDPRITNQIQALMDLALQEDGSDNITILINRVSSLPATRSPAST